MSVQGDQKRDYVHSFRHSIGVGQTERRTYRQSNARRMSVESGRVIVVNTALERTLLFTVHTTATSDVTACTFGLWSTFVL